MRADLLQTHRIIAPRVKDLHSNNLASQDTLLTAAKVASLPLAGLTETLQRNVFNPLFKFRLMFSLNRYVTHKPFACGNSFLLFIPQKIYTNLATVHLGAEMNKRGITKKHLITVGLRGYIELREGIWEQWRNGVI